MRAFFAFLLYAFIFAFPARAGLIRDAEIERSIRDLGTPIWEAAELDPEAIRIFILADPRINAYVAGGQNIFIHTGLIEAAETPEMLAGVLAHESGHIAGGHLAKGTEAVKGAQIGTILSFVLGIAAVAGGSGDAGMAVLTAGPSLAQRSMLSYSRANEESADQAGLTFLARTGMSGQGMLDMFNRLRRDERAHMGQVDPYALTHPLTTERISTMRAAVDASPLKDKRYPADIHERYARMRAKVVGFLEPPSKTLTLYRGDPSVAGRYATAIAYFRNSNIAQALTLMNGLITAEPKNAWFYDLKGQMLFENGRINEAKNAYALAYQYAPKEPQIATSYAKTLLATGDAAARAQAIPLLERASRQDATYDDTWRQLADAYGKSGREGEAHLALAEEASLADNQDVMRTQADLALKQISGNAAARLRAQDLRNDAIRRKREKQDAS